VRDLRDRALIATLSYSFSRITAALKMKVEDLRPQGAGWRVRLHDKSASSTRCRVTPLPKRCMAAHASPRTTKLYDRTQDLLTQSEVEKIRL
jgi:hypothetical protein